MMTNNNWEKTLIFKSSTIRDAILSLSNSGMQICILVNNDRKIIGTITDGDIRRSLIKGKYLDDPAMDIVNHDPITVSTFKTPLELKEIMEKHKIYQIPILNKKNCVVDLKIFSEITSLSKHENIFFILAGGFGKRLFPETNNCPKPMLKIFGKPILEHIILHAKKHGFNRFVISTHFLSNIIKKYFGNGEDLSVNITYIDEKEPLGTAGSLGYLNNTNEKFVVVVNGDVLTQVNFQELLLYHKEKKLSATIGVRHHEITNPYGVIKVNNGILEDIVEKPVYSSMVNAGIYVLENNVLNLVKKNQFLNMTDLLIIAKKNSLLTGIFPIHEPWIDVGQKQDLDKARNGKY